MSQFDTELEALEQQKPALKEVLPLLERREKGLSNTTILYGLSDLTPQQLQELQAVWKDLNPDYRSTLLQTLVDVSEANFELDYNAIGLMATHDPDPEVRRRAIELLWENETLEAMNRLLELVENDSASGVRAEAAKALGRFILMGELGDLPEAETTRAQQSVIRRLQDADESLEVRRRALESIANCSHALVIPAIQQAYNSAIQPMQVSALFAMGRTCDSDRWQEIILREISSRDNEMRYEAARASGELEIAEAVPHLGRLTMEEDREIKIMSIWALGEIGGKQASRILDALLEEAEAEDDEDLIEAIEDAIGNATLASGDLLLFEIDPEDLDPDDLYE